MPISRVGTVRPRRLALGLVALALAGCDIVQGFQDAGDALFPPVKTYLDAPGYRLVKGGYREMELVASSELFLVARSSKEGATGLFSMRYADPEPCEIPEVGRYWASVLVTESDRAKSRVLADYAVAWRSG